MTKISAHQSLIRLLEAPVYLGKSKLTFILTTAALATTTALATEAPSYWAKVSKSPSFLSSMNEQVQVESFKYLLDIDALYSSLKGKQYPVITVPNLDGSTSKFRLSPNTTFPLELAKKYPNIRSYSAVNVDNPEQTGRFELSHKGLAGMFNSTAGEWIFIDPAIADQGLHKLYSGTEARLESNKRPLDRVIEESSSKPHHEPSQQTSAPDFGTQLRSYRIAVSTAGEYTQFHGGSVADGLAAVNTAINRVNEVYNRDFAIQLNIIPNNDQVIFSNTGTDPFDNTTGDIDTNQTVLDNEIGRDNYDIGHIFNTGGGGLAYLGSVCSSSRKARGVTGLGRPTNDSFYIDYVAHEIGHQFRARHTFNGGIGSCEDNRSGGAAYEPGSGSTIMSYVGICGQQNLQSNSDAMFHTYSIDEVREFITTGNGASCGTLSDIDNSPPSVSVSSDFVIPAYTPFKLRGSASDSDDSDTANLSYSWEQLDLGDQTMSTSEMIDDGSRPLFRVFAPTDSPVRYFPQLSTVVEDNENFREVLPTTNRTMNFRLTVRDGRGGVASDDIRVTADNSAGPFVVNSPNTAGPFDGGTPITINWDVAGTASGDVNCPQVDIRLSSDAGVTFDQSLLVQTENDGTAEVGLPNADVSAARVMLICSDERFYNLSPVDFAIVQTEGIPNIIGQSSLAVNEDSSLTLRVTDLTIDDSDNSSPSDFTLTLYSGNSYTFDNTVVTPNENFDGNLAVNVSVNDGTNESAIFPVIIDVVAINDAPVIDATADNVETEEDTPITLTLADLTVTDVDDTQLSLSIEDGNNYTTDDQQVIPASNFNGTLSVGVSVSDGELTSNNATLSILVTPVNDAPTAENDELAVSIGATDVPLNVLANDSDPDTDDTLSISSFSYTGTGNLVLNNNGQLLFTPEQDFEGIENFTYEITDESGATASASATISVSSSSGGSIGIWSLSLILLLLRRKPTARTNIID